jgi:hypothetical protein
MGNTSYGVSRRCVDLLSLGHLPIAREGDAPDET